MPVIKLTLNEEYYQKLSEMAQSEKKSIQDFIRDKLFHEETIFTPEEAVNRAHDGRFADGKPFSLPDVYGDDWNIERGPAGVFGKRFYNYISDNEVGIVFLDMGKYGRRAMYKIKEFHENE